MKKTLFYMLVLALVLTVFAGCTKKTSDKAATSSTNETVSPDKAATDSNTTLPKKKFTFLDISHPSWPYDKSWLVWSLLEEKTGVTFDIQVPSGKLEDALSLTVASGNMPDLMYTEDKALADKYGLQGALANILEYVDEMPNFKKWMEKYPADTQNSLAADGKMYIFPNQGIGETNRMMWMYREDIFKKNNLTPPKDWDELYTTLKTLKQAYPDSYPLAWRDGLVYLLSFSASFNSSSDYYYDFDKKDWHFAPVEENYKKMIVYLNKFYREGLIPPDFLSIDTKQWQDLMSTEKSFITLDYVGRIDFYNTPLRKDNPAYNLLFMPPPAGIPGFAKNAFTQFSQEGVMVSSTSKNIKDVMKYFDFLYSEEGRILSSWGKEGVTYTVENGKNKLKPEYPTVPDLRKKTGLSTNGVYTWFDYDAHLSLSSPELQSAYEQARNYDALQQPMPAFSAEELDDINVPDAAIKKSRDENIAKFILGSRSLSEWDKYVEELKKLGLDHVISVYKTAHDRLLAAGKK